MPRYLPPHAPLSIPPCAAIHHPRHVAEDGRVAVRFTPMSVQTKPVISACLYTPPEPAYTYTPLGALRAYERRYAPAARDAGRCGGMLPSYHPSTMKHLLHAYCAPQYCHCYYYEYY